MPKKPTNDLQSKAETGAQLGVLLQPKNIIKTLASQVPFASAGVEMLNQLEGDAIARRLEITEQELKALQQLKAPAINVLGYKMAQLPEWVQRLWVVDNVAPDGGVSAELHMSQNLAQPADTIAPEVGLWGNLNLVQHTTVAKFGRPFFLHLPTEREFFRRIHRFTPTSLEDVCALCKEIYRVVVEPIDIGGLNGKVDPGNAAKANAEKLRQIRRVELWLTTAGHDGRMITRPLVGISELRQGDAHVASSSLVESLELFHISHDTTDYAAAALTIISSVANCLATIGMIIDPRGKVVV